MASRVLGFGADNVVAGEFMSFYTEKCTKEFRVSKKKRIRLPPATSPPSNSLRVNMLTHRSEKRSDHQKVCRGGRHCARLALQNAARAAQVLASLTSSRLCLRFDCCL